MVEPTRTPRGGPGPTLPDDLNDFLSVFRRDALNRGTMTPLCTGAESIHGMPPPLRHSDDGGGLEQEARMGGQGLRG